MYCKNCNCSYGGWTHACPVCGEQLVEQERSESPPLPGCTLDQLEQHVHQAGGELRFRAQTTAVEFRSRVVPPYFGFGQAYTQRIQGEQGPTWIDLKCASAGRDRQYSFLWRGFGFAWPDVLEGELCGNPLEVKTERVGRMRRWSFPFFGYGYAWAEMMHGTCGERLTVRLNLLEKRRFSRRRFPHLGFGYAWGAAYEVILSA